MAKSGKKSGKSHKIVDELIISYWMEMETIMNYIAHANNLEGVRAEEIKKALQADIQEELGHAQSLAGRIRILGGIVPGSATFESEQSFLQPSKDTTDVASVIKGVIEAENSAIKQYNKIIELCDGTDYVTQDVCVRLLSSEEEHRREFIGFLKEYEKK